jgi:3-oxoacyl-[acyl-carrier-protein] synthase-3
MGFITVPHVRIAGMAGAIPTNEISNYDYDWISEKDRELLIKTTGVEKRRIVPGKNTLTTSDFCMAAANRLIEELAWARNEIDILIFVSQSRDYMLPQTSTILQDQLGLSHSCLTLDICLGCSAYPYGLSVIASMMQGGTLRKALLMVGDVSSISTNPKDKSAYPLFGDAGTVTALEYEPAAPPMHFHLQSDGSGFDAIIIPEGGLRSFVNPDTSFTETLIEEGIVRTPIELVLDGQKIFLFSLREVAPNIRELLAYAQKEIEEVDYLVLHQANRLINETIRKKMKMPAEKVPYTIHKIGNTSCASIPITMIMELADQLRTGRCRHVLSGFGVGLSWGSAYIETDRIVVLPVVELDWPPSI